MTIFRGARPQAARPQAARSRSAGLPLDLTVAQLTARTLLGKRRAWLLVVLPVVLVLLALVLRVTVSEGARPDVAVGLLAGFALATLVPLLGLIAGTGAIGPEIDDGSIVYLLAKPLNRHSIVFSKLTVAASVVTALAAVPVGVAGLVLMGAAGRVWFAFAAGALVAGVAYCALFLLVAVLTRNAVVIGLIYSLVWEALIGSYVPGAQALSVQQWSMALVVALVDSPAQRGVDSAVGLGAGVILLAVVTVGSTALAGSRLRSLRLTGEE